MNLPEYICVLDLETAGKFPSPILEVGMVMLTKSLNWVGDFHAVVKQPVSSSVIKDDCDEVVQKMHTKNGLWDDLDNLAVLSIEMVDEAAANWVRETTGGERHCALSGSGVSHFDRPFIRAQMPKLNKRFTYWHLDVGNERRMLQLADREDLIPSITEDVGGPAKTHRALEDARVHTEELRSYIDLFSNIPRLSTTTTRW